MPEKDPLELVLVRPGEPSFMPKDKYQFDMPPELLDERYRDVAKGMEAKGDDKYEKIPVKSIPVPEIKTAKNLSKSGTFSIFNEAHQGYAKELIDMFYTISSKDVLLATALYVRDHVNTQLFVYAYMVALLHRKDTGNIELPSMFDSIPERFVSRSVLYEARKEAYVVPPNRRRVTYIPPHFTANDLYPEQRMAYFREDLGVNLHHAHWHLVYPASSPGEISRKDRRGELFFYMHGQILQRYNMGRICNALKYVEALHNLRKPLETGYYSKLTMSLASRNYPGRPDDILFQDFDGMVNEPPIRMSDVEMYTKRVKDGIQLGYFEDQNGEKVDLINDQGVNIVGDVVESSNLSVNRPFYGDLHNLGHRIISTLHDPHNDFMEEAGVMADLSTAMRDPVFYQWHTFINEFYELHKSTLPPYTQEELGFSNIEVTGLEIFSEGKSVDELLTFWQQSEVNVAGGLDFAKPGANRISFRHLNHQKFEYRITVQNKGAARRGTIRIFLLPLYDDAWQAFSIQGSRLRAIEMDRYAINLTPGVNNITRKSSESTVTIPFESIFPDVTVNEEGMTELFMTQSTQEAYCRCGWPEYLLIPIGTVVGYPCRVFAMVSDYEQDKVEDGTGACSESLVFCGLRDSRYPDLRPMGYPFDKPIWVDFENFLLSNMITKDITIRHIDEIRQRYKAADMREVSGTQA